MPMTLDEALARATTDADAPLASLVLAIAAATRDIAGLLAMGALAGTVGTGRGQIVDGGAHQEIDVRAHTLMMHALTGVYVAAATSKESDDWQLLDATAPYAVTLDTLDGSPNIDTNISIGTIFSILPAKGKENPFTQAGSHQVAAGFAVYGPCTLLVLTLGKGVNVFTLDPRDHTWRLTHEGVQITASAPEYAVNASNYRHWNEPVRTFIDDCVSGTEGPREKNFNMRWIGSLVAEAFRILTRGGVILYPGDVRPGNREGRLRLIHEAHPIAFVMEQAGGLASNGTTRILEMSPESLHQRVPLFFGSRAKVALIERLHHSQHSRTAPSPLFGQRGLFRV